MHHTYLLHTKLCVYYNSTAAIKYDFLREKINKNGCCGAAELIKLNSYRLIQYDVVIHMDADTFIQSTFEELFYMKQSLIYTTGTLTYILSNLNC